MRLVALAGLPGTGKTTLARALAARLGGRRIDKDEVRAALFAREEIEYSSAQDDLVIECIHRVVAFLATGGRVPAVVLDGRTYTRRRQVEELTALARGLATPLALIECTATPETVRHRIALDRARGEHPAGNRTIELYERLRREAEPITVPRLVLASDEAPLDELVERALDFVEHASSIPGFG